VASKASLGCDLQSEKTPARLGPVCIRTGHFLCASPLALREEKPQLDETLITSDRKGNRTFMTSCSRILEKILQKHSSSGQVSILHNESEDYAQVRPF
jgi:hypothetical protein